MNPVRRGRGDSEVSAASPTPLTVRQSSRAMKVDNFDEPRPSQAQPTRGIRQKRLVRLLPVVGPREWAAVNKARRPAILAEALAGAGIGSMLARRMTDGYWLAVARSVRVRMPDAETRAQVIGILEAREAHA